MSTPNSEIGRDYGYRCVMHEPMEFDMADQDSVSTSGEIPRAAGVNGAPAGKTDAEIQLLRSVFYRPRMYCADIDNLKELLIFVQGLCKGNHRPGGIDCQEFAAYVNGRFKDSGTTGSWTSTLLKQFGDRPFLDALVEIVQIIDDWRG